MSPFQRRIALDRIVAASAAAARVRPRDVMSRVRWRPASDARLVAMWLTREVCSAPHSVVGGLFDRDHSTVIHACHRMHDDIADGGDLRRLAERTIEILQQRKADA